MKEDNKMDLSSRSSANFTPNYLPSMRDANQGKNTEIADLKRQINELKELMRNQTNMSSPSVDTDNQSSFQEERSGVTFRDIQKAKNIYTVPSKNNKTRNQMFHYYTSHDSADMEKEVLRKIRQPLEVKYTRVKRKQVVQQPEELKTSQTDSKAERVIKEDIINKKVEENITIPSIQQENSTIIHEQNDVYPKDNHVNIANQDNQQVDVSEDQPDAGEKHENTMIPNNQSDEPTADLSNSDSKQGTIVEDFANPENKQNPSVEQSTENNRENTVIQEKPSDGPSTDLSHANMKQEKMDENVTIQENQQANSVEEHLSADDNQLANPLTNADDMHNRADEMIDSLDNQGLKPTTEATSIDERQSSDGEMFQTDDEPAADPPTSQQLSKTEKETVDDSTPEQNRTNNNYKKSVFEYIWDKIK